MPNRDGTGPDGRGARTGGGRGNCTNSSVPPRRGPGNRPRRGPGRRFEK